MTIDPAVLQLLCLSMATLWLASAAHKLRDRRAFRDALSGYELLPEWTLGSVAVAVPVVEFVAGIGLIVRWSSGAILSFCLLALYSAAVGINLRRGRRDLDCGCGMASISRQTISEWILARNAVLAGLSLAIFIPVGPRVLGVGDAATILAGAVAVSLIYLSANQLAATWPSRYGHTDREV